MRSFILILLVLSLTNAVAKQTAKTGAECPATLTLSAFEKAMIASLNNQDLVVTRMMMEGDVLTVAKGTAGHLLEEQLIMGGRMPVVRFAYPYNPNGEYGVWLLKNCF